MRLIWLMACVTLIGESATLPAGVPYLVPCHKTDQGEASQVSLNHCSHLLRNLRAWLLLVTGLVGIPGPLAWAGDTFSASELADDIWAVAGPAGNTLVARDRDGLVLIEGVPATHAEAYLAFVLELTGEERIKALVNTHWHDDSAGLNASLAGSDTAVIAHFNTRQWLGATIRKRGDTILHTPVPEADLPDTTFHDSYRIPFRDSHIELGYLLHAHTDGDVYALFPEQNILFTGPVLRADDWNPVDEATNGFVGGMLDGLHALSAHVNAGTTVVPASGKVLDKTEFDALVALYQQLFDAMVAELRKARSAEEVVLANPAAGLMPGWGAPDDFLDQGFRSFYGHLRSTRHVGVMP